MVRFYEMGVTITIKSKEKKKKMLIIEQTKSMQMYRFAAPRGIIDYGTLTGAGDNLFLFVMRQHHQQNSTEGLNFYFFSSPPPPPYI